MEQRSLLFVYGTLMRGERSHGYLGDAELVGRDRTEAAFTLVRVGWYPAMCDGGTTAVVGEVWRVGAQTLARLDLYEGVPDLYERRRMVLESGCEAWVYVAKSPRIRALSDVIVGGDWREGR